MEKRTTLQVQKEPLEKVLALITQQTGVRFSYNSQVVNPQTKVSINAQNKPIKEVLSKILPSSVAYKRVGEHIVFYAAPLKDVQPDIQPVRFENPDSVNSKINTAENQSNDKNLEKNDISDNGKPADDCLNSKSAAEDTLQLIKDTESLTKKEEMKAEIAGLMMAIAAASTPLSAQDTAKEVTKVTEVTEVTDSVAPEKIKPFQLTFIYPIGTGGVRSFENSYHFSLNILGGVTGEVKGAEFGSLFNINKYGATGAQFAGIFNTTAAGKPDIYSHNAQFAGIFNYTHKGTSVQFAGIFNNGDTALFQAAGICNVAAQTSFQAAGIANVSYQRAMCQVAGIANVAKKSDSVDSHTYFQAAGISNIASQTDCQLAGIANIASKTVFQAAGIANAAQESTCQMAGIVNITKKGCFQAGLINIRDTADGISLGLINIVKHGGIMEAGIEAGEFVHTALTFRSGTQRLYSKLFIGYNYSYNFWAYGAGLGTSFNLIKNLGLNLELTHSTLHGGHIFYIDYKKNQWNSFIQFTPMLNYRFAKHFKIYAGPSLNIYVRHDEGILNNINGNLVLIQQEDIPYGMYHRQYRHSILNMWVGVVGGIKF